MFQYYESLSEQEREEIGEIIRLLQNQTFVLEKKYDMKSERYTINRAYRNCERYLDFLKLYFKIGDAQLIENRQYGIMFLKTRNLQGDKLGRLATIFILLLKLIFDEQMNTASNSLQVYTTLDEIYDKIKLFRLWDQRSISMTEVRRALACLKKYQVLEVLDETGDLAGSTRIIIYPSINLLLDGQALEGLIAQYQIKEEGTADGQISGTEEGLFK